MKEKTIFIDLQKIVNIAIDLGMVAIFIIAISKFGCNRCPDCPEFDIIHDTIPGDSVPYPVKVDKPVPVYRDTGSTQWRDHPIDTMAILRDYYAKYFYDDTITDDTSFFAVIRDTITQNRIANRQFFFRNLKPTFINTLVNIKEKDPEPKRMLFAGFDFSGNKDALTSFGPELIYKNKQDNLFSLGYNLLDEKANIQAGYYLLVRLKRP